MGWLWACPPLRSMAAPTCWPSTANVTVPVGTGPAVEGADTATWAVRVTTWPNVGEPGDAVNVLAVAAWLMVTLAGPDDWRVLASPE